MTGMQRHLLTSGLAGLVLLAAVPAPARTLFAGGHWVAVEGAEGRSCAALARSELIAPKGSDQARVSFSFDRGGPRQGELHVRLSRPARAGSSVLLVIGGQPFQLLGRGADAWSRGPAQEGAIIAALRRAGDMRVRFRGSTSGYTDRYLLSGAPTAIDAAAAACSRRR
jgi:hypothetical protein